MKKTVLFFIFILFYSFGSHINTIRADPVDETGFIDFIEANPNTIVFDFRWESIYEQGHFAGAYLINSSLTDEERKAKVDSILESEHADLSTPLAMYCNCETGGLSHHMEEYLQDKGYTNTISLNFSFSLWDNSTFLVTGSDRFYPDTAPSVGIDLGLFALAIPVLLVIKKRYG